MSDNINRIRRIELGLPSVKMSRNTDIILSVTSDNLSKWMAINFNKNFDAYDTAIDALYNETGIGGSRYHHVIDGNHTIMGALESVEGVYADDSFLREILEAGEHLLRDTASVSGINPFISLSSENFDKLASLSSNFGIPRVALADILTINGPELIGGSMGMLASIIAVRNHRFDCLSELSGSYFVSSLITLNPLLLTVAASMMIKSMNQSSDKKEPILKAGKGSLVTGGALTTSNLIGGPIWIGVLASVCTAIAIEKCIDSPENTFANIKKILLPAKSIYQQFGNYFRKDYTYG